MLTSPCNDREGEGEIASPLPLFYNSCLLLSSADSCLLLSSTDGQMYLGVIFPRHNIYTCVCVCVCKGKKNENESDKYVEKINGRKIFCVHKKI